MRKSVFMALVASSLIVLSGVTGRAGTLWDQWFGSPESGVADFGDQPFLGPRNISLKLLNDEISGSAFVTLDTTGKLKYAVRSNQGDFLAWGAKLLVKTSPRAVPDGGATLMLLGVALAGIEPLRRRMARRNTQPRRA